MTKIILNWKEYPVKTDRFHEHLEETCPSYDGMVTSEENLIVILLSDNQIEIDEVNNYWAEITELSQQQLNESEVFKLYSDVVKDAIDFSNSLIVEFAAENIIMGITQAGKTKLVADYLQDVIRYLQTGSLYEALNSIVELENSPIPEELSPFITEQRLTTFKSEIQNYLSS